MELAADGGPSFRTPGLKPVAGTLERLGTTFVKPGQSLSFHGEFLPDEFVSELSKLQEHVAPFPIAKAKEEIQKSFVLPLKELFHSFDSEPMMAGSVCKRR